MTSTLARATAPSGIHIVHQGEASAGPFMLTLCRLVEPVSIRPPQAPHLRPFTFFTSRARQHDGSEPLYLHMGFFETRQRAERWARAARGRHPEAYATFSPTAFWHFSASAPPEWRPMSPEGPALESQHIAPIDSQSLTDTQVLDILEMRRPGPARNDGGDRASEHIELLRPDETGVRRALKEAVIEGAPVSFAVQLNWSARPIDPSGVPSLAIFRSHTLYVLESHRAGRTCFFLRLGFFADPVSAKEVASLVRSRFAAAAVVPVLEQEIASARQACMDTSLIPRLLQQHLDQAPGPGGTNGWTTAPGAGRARRRGTAAASETLEQTLEQLAQRELWNNPDLLSDTGVRHLKVEVQ